MESKISSKETIPLKTTCTHSIFSCMQLAEKEQNKKLMKAFAKIHFPATAIVTEPKRHIQLESFKEFEKIHNLFIQ